MNNRLLFAAARGARLQVRVFEFDKWINTPGIHFGNYDVYRIHPSDSEKEYGPISSALRRMADDEYEFIFSEDEIPDWMVEVATKCEIADRWRSSWFHQTPDERRIALCVMAEALADKGL